MKESQGSAPRWVPLTVALLLLLVGLLALVALTASAGAGGDRDRAGQPGASSTIVTGPSLTSPTCMSAPNAPRSTCAPSRSSSAQKAS